MAGYIKLYRGWMDTPALDTAERKIAWLWLIENACWKPARFNVKGRTVALERGQICASVRQLAEVWGWSKSAVERFLTRLQTETMIECEAGHGKNVITVCNYGKYQDCDDGERDGIGTLTETGAGQQRDTKEERKERKKENKGGYAFSGRVIRLNAADLTRWTAAFNLLDLPALLQSRDDWFVTQSQDIQRRWFNSTSNWLAKQQQAASAEAREIGKVGVGI